jgi:hypothetical protein
MLKDLSARIAAYATFNRFLGFALLYAALISVLAWLAAGVSEHTGDFRLIELEPLWHPEELLVYVQSLPPEALMKTRLMLLLDIVIIVSYMLMFAYLISILYKESIPADHPRMRLNLLPFIMGDLDLLENLFLYLLPGGNLFSAQMANGVILAKISVGVICMGVIGHAMLSAYRARSSY